MNDDEQQEFVKSVQSCAHNFRLRAELEALNNTMDYTVGYGHIGIGWKVENKTGDLKRTTWTHGSDLIPVTNGDGQIDDVDAALNARYGRHNPLYGPEQVIGMTGDKHVTEWMADYYQTPTMERDGALVYHNRMINLMRSPENGTLKQLMESKATKLCLYGTRFTSPRDFQEFMIMIPMTVTELVIHHTGVFGDVEVKALVKVLKRPQLRSVELKIRLLSVTLIEAIRDNPSITSLVLHQPYRDDKKVTDAIFTLVSRKLVGRWQRFEYYPHYQVDTIRMVEYTRLLKYSPDLTTLGLNLDRVGWTTKEGDYSSFFRALAKSKLERLRLESRSGSYSTEALLAISQMKHLKELTIPTKFWKDWNMMRVLRDCPRLERILVIQGGENYDIVERIKQYQTAFRWPLRHVGYLFEPPDSPLEEVCIEEAAEALNRIHTLKASRLVQMIGHIDKLPLILDIIRHVCLFIPFE